ncbi:transcriptional regulator with XRE-family HTH domain [Clostridium moniliforme]|uniref:Transcriptional regulator with XRE-family HTH domain n=1 Tax=Clostridium moniliforme TaxID=39489 RepID=A0ABS4F0K3_9CLOT|nr:helix-turn-helix transcriptional regulator [Clostridium moniliforme]MBP1889781.1 transcriptional regulator with XRE-family HTH domain [Clostridium moniliforme]
MIGLEFVCKNMGIRYIDLAEQLGIGKQSITNWIMGRRNIPDKHLEKLSEILKVAPEWLQKELTEDNKVQLFLIIKNYQYNEDLNENSKIHKMKEIKNMIISNLEVYFNKWYKENNLSTMEVSLIFFQMLSKILDKEKLGVEVIQKILKSMELAYEDENFKDNIPEEDINFIQAIKIFIEKEDIKDKNNLILEELIKENSFLKEKEIKLLKKFNLFNLNINEQIEKLKKINKEYDNKEILKLINKLKILLDLL